MTSPVTPAADRLARFLDRHARVCVLTGAGCSTASGIPGYRDEKGAWQHSPPVQYAEFVNHAAARRRYWARSLHGWPRFAAALPNPAHAALAALESAGPIDSVLTQNVDNLHRRAGSRAVIDLHGRLDEVTCLGCGDRQSRSDLQARLEADNGGIKGSPGELRPDGDVALDTAGLEEFVVPDCKTCGGLLKPDVVFFGESVPRERVALAREAVDQADALLVVGSSLMVFSGFRFVRQAVAAGKPVAILNRGVTRADDLASLRLDADCVDVLAAVAGSGALA